MVAPTAKVAPGKCVLELLDTVQLSAAVGAVHVTAASQFVPAKAVWLAGQLDQVGAVASVTVTVNEHVAVLAAPSVTLKILVVTPSGKVEPLARPDCNVVVGPLQLSVPTGAV